MATFNSIQRYSLPFFFLLILHLVSLSAELASHSSLQGFDNADFGSDFALLGDAQLRNGTSCVDLTTRLGSSSGNVVFKKHLKLIDGEPRQPVSFSSDFVFSMSSNSSSDGDGLALLIAAAGDPSLVFGEGPFGVSKDFFETDGKFVAVEYDTRKDYVVKDVNGDHVGVDVGSFVSREAVDVSSMGLVLNGGEKLRSWVDYDANSKTLEIRLSKFGSGRPSDPLISYPIDLLTMWGEREILLGISSSNGGSERTSSACSWSLRIGTGQPPDPRVNDDHKMGEKRKKNCALTIIGGVIFATGCGTLVAFFILFLWVILFIRHLEVTPEIPLKTVDFRYERIDVNVDKTSMNLPVSIRD